jgi:hypothetical protein
LDSSVLIDFFATVHWLEELANFTPTALIYDQCIATHS